jgi:hypothetical protein
MVFMNKIRKKIETDIYKIEDFIFEKLINS